MQNMLSRTQAGSGTAVKQEQEEVSRNHVQTFIYLSVSLIQSCLAVHMYRGVNKGVYVLLSRTPAEPGRAVKQEQEEVSRNHLQTFIYLSVYQEKQK